MTLGKLTRNLIIIAMLLGFAACDKGGAKKDPNVDYYTCTMHPSVRSQDPKAKCPICSMNLVPVMKKGAPTAGHDPQHGAAPMSMSGETKADSGLNELPVLMSQHDRPMRRRVVVAAIEQARKKI